MRRVASRLAIVAAIVGVQFIVFEAGLRLQAGSEAAPEFQSLFATDARIGHVLTPGASARFSTAEFSTDIRINALGVRDEELGPKTVDERRVVVLGDSLVMAVQVDLRDTFTARLQARLNEGRSPHRYRVVNAGVQGYGPVEERLFLEHMIDTLEPDLVVVTVYAGNDAIEAVDSAPKLDSRETLADRADEASRWLRRVVRRSVVLQTVRLRLQAVLTRLTTPAPERPLLTYLAEEDPRLTRGLQLTAASIAAMRDEAAAHGAAFAVLLMPARFQVDDGDFGRLATAVANAGGRLERDAGTQRFARALEPLGVPVLDVLPAFRAHPERGALYFQRTAHLTPLGHRVVAAELDAFLRAQGLASDTSADSAERPDGDGGAGP